MRISPTVSSTVPRFSGRSEKPSEQEHTRRAQYDARVAKRYGGKSPIAKRYGDVIGGTLILNTIRYPVRAETAGSLKTFLGSRRSRIIERLTTPVLLSSYVSDNAALVGVSYKDLKLRAKAGIVQALAELEQAGLLETRTTMGVATVSLTPLGERVESLGQVHCYDTAAEKDTAYERLMTREKDPSPPGNDLPDGSPPKERTFL